jgi:hypothetical protein
VLRLSRLFKSLVAVLLLMALAACATGGRSEQGQDVWFVANPVATQTGCSTVCADGIFAKASFPDSLLKEMAQTHMMHSAWINEVELRELPASELHKLLKQFPAHKTMPEVIDRRPPMYPYNLREASLRDRSKK